MNLSVLQYYISGNVLYRTATGDDKDDKNKLLDEDLSTSLENKDYKPFLRVQLNKSITIDKLDITLLLGNIIYKLLVICDISERCYSIITKYFTKYCIF